MTLYGPKELAKRITDRAAAMNERFRGVLGAPPDQHIENLIELAYHASLMPEEGRYPRFRLVLTSGSSGHGIGFAQSFFGYSLDTPDSLRRLAPAVGGQGTALLVGPGSTLNAWRIVDVERGALHGPVETPNRLQDTWFLPNGALFLRVEGPGELRVLLHPGPVFHLRGGQVRELKSYPGFPLR